MLQIIRDLSKSWIAKALMVLLIVSFGIWGVGDLFRGNPMQRVVAEVGKIDIVVQALEQQFKESLPEARKVFGPDLTEPQARELGVLQRTLDLMIEQAIFDQEMKRLGLNVSDEAIMAKLAAEPQLRDKDGRFNITLWKQALQRGGYSERSFLDSERRSAARRLLLESLADPVTPPKTMIDNLYVARGAKRILEILTVANDSITDVPAPDEKSLQEFYQRHGDVFEAPEVRTITIASLQTEAIAKDIKISEEELKKMYEERANEWTLPEQRDLVQVVFQDEAKAKAFADAAKTSRDLIGTAKAQTLTSVNLNRVDEKTILPELYTTIFALEDKQISDPVKSGLGWHVVQVKKIYPGGKQSFEEIREKLLERARNEMSADIVVQLENQWDDSLAAAQSREEIADSLKLRLIKIPDLNAQGKLKDGKEPAEFPEKKEILAAAFGLNAGEISSIINDKKGNSYAVRVDDINPAHIEPFEKVKEQVAMEWKRKEQAVRAAAESENIAKAMREGAKATTFAGRKGVDIRLSKPISLLGEIDPQLPMEAMPKVLMMEKGDVITHPAPDRQYVLRLADIIQVDPAKPDEARLKVVDDMNEKMAYELIEEYSRFLRQRFPVKINQELFETLKRRGT